MKKILNLFAATLVCVAFNQNIALASSHREAPLIAFDPVADNTDLYAFRSPADTNKVVLIANYIPFELPQGGPNYYNFAPNVRYEIHIKNKATNPGTDDITYRFTFSQTNQDPTTFFNIRLGQQNLKTTYTLERSIAGVNGGAFATIVSNGVVPANNIGPRSIDNATLGLNVPNYDTLMFRGIMAASTGERVFAGPADDPFFVDLGGAFDVGGFRNPGRDGLAKFNCHSIAIEVPISMLQKDGKNTTQATSILDGDFVIGVYASASRQAVSTFDSATATSTNSGNWIQVSRLGMPLTNEVVVPIGDKDRWNGAAPTDSTGFQKYFKNPELALYMADAAPYFGTAVPGLAPLRIQTASLGTYDFRNGKPGLFPLKGNPALDNTALSQANFGDYLLPDGVSPRAVDILPIFSTGVPNLRPYQLAAGKPANNPLAAGKPFVNNFLPTFSDLLRLNMAVPVTPRTLPNGQPNPEFSSLGLIQAAVLGLTDTRFNGNGNQAEALKLQNIPNMDGFPNGRRLEDDVTTIELQAVGGVVLAAIGLWYDDYNTNGNNPVSNQLLSVVTFNAGVTKNDTAFKTVFPFVQAPWRGFTGAQYSGPKSQDPLPVNFISFTAEKEASRVKLNWRVSNEINNDRYEVEHSLDGRTYASIGSVRSQDGTNVHNYNLVHNNPSLNGLNYYRIKQVDKDSKFSYSEVRLVRFTGKNILTVTPNPTSDVIRVFSDRSNINVSVYDGHGRKVATRVAITGSTQFNISSYANGIYLVVAEKDGVRLETTKVIKQ